LSLTLACLAAALSGLPLGPALFSPLLKFGHFSIVQLAIMIEVKALHHALTAGLLVWSTLTATRSALEATWSALTVHPAAPALALWGSALPTWPISLPGIRTALALAVATATGVVIATLSLAKSTTTRHG
jgi:hypothetical protein